MHHCTERSMFIFDSSDGSSLIAQRLVAFHRGNEHWQGGALQELLHNRRIEHTLYPSLAARSDKNQVAVLPPRGIEYGVVGLVADDNHRITWNAGRTSRRFGLGNDTACVTRCGFGKSSRRHRMQQGTLTACGVVGMHMDERDAGTCASGERQGLLDGGAGQRRSVNRHSEVAVGHGLQSSVLFRNSPNEPVRGRSTGEAWRRAGSRRKWARAGTKISAPNIFQTNMKASSRPMSAWNLIGLKTHVMTPMARVKPVSITTLPVNSSAR